MSNVSNPNTAFAERVLTWFDEHGRKHLPWQQNINPYRVWISEIMLQQTQVATVIDYFERFMQRFPDVESLACAELDEVLHLWSGLGYYSRAKNLHKSAQTVWHDYQGQFPSEQEALEALPGIGRSTAAAIRSIAFQEKATILDGNVKRVIARHQAIDGWPGQSKTLKVLWLAAEQFTPDKRNNHYTQAMMDIGATLCTRTKPKCALCPVQADCLAEQQDDTARYPGKKPKKALPIKQAHFLLLHHEQHILLEQRPLTGIWPGLYGLIEKPETQCLDAVMHQLNVCAQTTTPEFMQFRHTFSHYHLDINVTRIECEKPPKPQEVFANDSQIWYKLDAPQNIGFAAPMTKILKQLKQQLAQPNGE